MDITGLHKGKGESISEEIIIHQRVYEMAGIDIPAYRMTCKEHKYLVAYLTEILALPKDWKSSMIGWYHGVEIEVVMIVDPYL